jgi:hypothetical protein
MKTKRILVTMDPDLAAALQKNYETTGVRISEFVRRACRLALHADQYPPRIEKRNSPSLFPTDGDSK